MTPIHESLVHSRPVEIPVSTPSELAAYLVSSSEENSGHHCEHMSVIPVDVTIHPGSKVESQ